MSLFQKKLKNLLKSRQLKNSDLSRLSKIPYTTINKWLKNDADPKLSNLLQLAKALNLSVGELIGDFGGNAQLTEDDKRWLTLSPKHKKLLLTFLDAILESQKE